MTCDDVREIDEQLRVGTRKLSEVTTSELIASRNHVSECLACREFFTAKIAEMEARVHPLSILKSRIVAGLARARIEREAGADPEIGK